MRWQRQPEAASGPAPRRPPARPPAGEGTRAERAHGNPSRRAGGTWGVRLPVAQSVSGSACGKPPSPARSETTVSPASAPTACSRPDARPRRPPLPLLQLSAPSTRFPGSRRAFGCGFGRHVVRRRRGCPKDGSAEAAATAAAGGGRGGSGSVEPTLLCVRRVPRPGVRSRSV